MITFNKYFIMNVRNIEYTCENIGRKLINGVSASSLSSRFFKHYGNCRVIPLESYCKLFPGSLTFEGLASVKRLMKFLETGIDCDYLSPFCNRANQAFSSDSALFGREGGIRIVDRLLVNCELYHENSLFRLFELNQKDSIGNASKVLPFRDRSQPVFDFFSKSDDLNFDHDCLDKAVFDVMSLLPKGSLFKDDIDDVFTSSEKTTQWGSPFFLHGNQPIGDGIAADKYLALAKFDLQRESISKFPAVMVTRTQQNGTDIPKQRVAWALGHSSILIELQFLKPLIKFLSNSDHFSELHGQERTNDNVTKLFQRIKKTDKILGFDVSAYDLSIPKVLIEKSFDVIKFWFQSTDSRILNGLCDNLVTSDLITPLGVFTGRRKGVSSGSGLTNIVDSLVQLILFHYCVRKVRADINDSFCTVNGDDGIWFVKDLDPESLSSFLSDFGLRSNVDKISYSSDGVTFCQRLYLRGYLKLGRNVGIRSAYRTIGSILSYERKRKYNWNSLCDSVRCIAQLNELRFNPIFEEFVMSMVLIDEFGLGLNFHSKLNGLLIESGGIERVLTLSGASSWERERSILMTKNVWSLSVIRLIVDIGSNGREELINYVIKQIYE